MSSFFDLDLASQVLTVWRNKGFDEAKNFFYGLEQDKQFFTNDLLMRELKLRIDKQSGPRLIVDGVWLSRPPGGITRVWQQILKCWQLPNLIYKQAPISIIDRVGDFPSLPGFYSQSGKKADPLSAEDISLLAEENLFLATEWNADVFISTWISSCGKKEKIFKELALVHDCLPERYKISSPMQSLRRRWLLGANQLLAVSSDTANDLEVLLKKPANSIHWCHPGLASDFKEINDDELADTKWERCKRKAGIKTNFLLLPATSAIGSYKNPELVANALCFPGLENIQLVLTGLGAGIRQGELEEHFPALTGRIIAAGFNDIELALAYKNAIAVVMPSHIEGFGLPVVEALSVNGLVLIADSRGLREAAGDSCLKFSSRKPDQLASICRLLLDSDRRSDLVEMLSLKRQARLEQLNSDLIGLCLLAMARQLL